LTPLEKIRKAVRLEEQSPVPVVPQITYTTYQLTGVKMLEAIKDPKKMSQALIAGFEEIGYDAIYSGWESSFNIMAEAIGCKMNFPEDDVPSVAKGIIEKKEDIEKILVPDPYKSPGLAIHLETLQLIRKHVGPDVPLFNYIPGPLTLAGLLMGTDRLMINIIKNPEMVKLACGLTTDAAKAFALAKIESGGDVMVVADPTASGSLISPAMFEQFALPYLKEMFSAISEKGAISSLHICGNTTPLLEKLVETGAEIIEIDYVVNMEDAKKRVGNRVCIQGNVDPSKVMLLGTPDDVYRASERCIREGSKGGGFILSTGCEVPLNAPVENVKAMVRAAKEMK